jgi:hypothetical protein
MSEPKYQIYKDGKWLYTDDPNMVREVFGVEIPKKPYPCPKCGSNNISTMPKKSKANA